MATINGTPNDDVLAGTPDNDIILGLAGDDELSDDAGKDKLDGGDGNDILDGGADNDTLIGGAHDDSLFGGTGVNVLIGGKGNDFYYVQSAGDKLTEAAGQGHDSVVTILANTTLGANFEDLYLFVGAFNGTGNTLSNVIVGNDGVNTLNGAAGNDTLDGGLGVDSLVGGTGNDVYFVDNALDVVTEKIGGGIDTIKTTVDDFILAANVENLALLGIADLSATGNELSNLLVGNERSNTLIGGKGNDTLDGGLSTDMLKGGLGNDVYIVDGPGDLVIEDPGQGKDTIHCSGNYKLLDGQEVETLIFTSASDTLGIGNGFNNTMTMTGAGKAGLNGGAGNDVVTGGANDDFLNGGNGNDVVNGGAGKDNLFGDADNDTLNGGEGDDFLDGGDGKSVLAGGKGNDSYVVRSANDKVVELSNQGSGDLVTTAVSYILAANVENLTFIGAADINGTGNALANELKGNNAANRLDGAAGRDEIFGAAGNDTLIGGTGNDELNGDVGADQLIGGTGNDGYTIDDSFDTVVEKSGGGFDSVFTTVDKMILADNVEDLLLQGSADLSARGNALSNGLYGNLGNNVLMDDKGNDTLDGFFGADTLIGGSGNDTYFVDDSNDVVEEDAGKGKDTVRSNVDYTLKEGEEIETLILSSIGLIVGKGNSVNNVITVTGTGYGSLSGEGGNDTITGAAGSDNIRGGSGNDKLVGGDGGDEINGGAGKDVMIGGKGNDEYTVDDLGDKITELAKQGDDWVDSSLANYTLGANLENLGLDDGGLNGTGNALNNILFGNELGNVLNGAAGRDTLFGNDGNDTLKGGAGFDILEGNSGADVLYSEADAIDVFRYQISSAGELVTLGGDTINGFKSIQDRIELTDLIADFGINPDLAFTNGYVYLIDNGANTDLLFDKDGIIGAGVPLVLATIVNADVLQVDVMVQGFVNP